MPRHVEQPTRTPIANRVHGEYEETHPAYGTISASRYTGTAVLFGSDFVHHNFVMITISRASLKRDLSRDWIHSGDELIQVALSEAQWATFVSSLNHGTGPCCTIDHLQGVGQVPELPMPIERTKQFTDEMARDCETAIKSLDALAGVINTLPGLSMKAKRDLSGYVVTAQRKLSDSIPFVAKSFGEHVEHTTEAAKQELYAHMQQIVQRAGLTALRAGDVEMPIELPHATEEVND